jgi:hypothetical protein
MATALDAYLAGAPAPAELDRARVAETTEWTAQPANGRGKRRRQMMQWGAGVVALTILIALGVWGLLSYEPAVPRPPPTVFEKGQLIEFPGGQIVAGISEPQMQSWLAEREFDRHSVQWLDATVVDGKPVFAGLAMLDDRAANWRALIDLTKEQANDVNVLIKERELDVGSYQITNLSGYVSEGKLTGLGLYHAGATKGISGVPDLLMAQLNISMFEKQRCAVRIARPIPGTGTELFCALYMQSGVLEKPVRDLQLSEEALNKMLEEQRVAGFYPTSVVPYEFGGENLFAAVFREDPQKKPWEHARDLTAAELQTKATEWAAKKMQPVSIIIYPVDGAARFSAVWRQE